MQFNETEILFIKLCEGIVKICDRINRGDPAYIVDNPSRFPQPLYEAFQSLSLKWIQQGEMRHPSILCLIEAARESVKAIDPIFVDLVDFPDEPLIDNKTHPSDGCNEWASEYSLSFERDLNQSYIPRLMAEIQKRNLPFITYTFVRRFIAENPFPAEVDLAQFQLEHPEVEPVFDLLMEAYQDAPPQSKAMPLCKTCGGYLDCAARDIKGCCEPLEKQIDKAPIIDTVICLIRPSFIELRLEQKLKNIGLQVELWPQLDKADLKIVFSTGEIWAIDAKDWGIAKKLARELNEDDIPDIGQSWSCFVVPDYRWNDLKYRATFQSLYKGNLTVLSESELIKRVKEVNHER